MSTDDTFTPRRGKLVAMDPEIAGISRRRLLRLAALATATPPLLAACSSGASSTLESSEDTGLSLQPSDDGVGTDSADSAASGDDTAREAEGADRAETTEPASDPTLGDPTSGSDEASSTTDIAFTYFDGSPGTLGDFVGKPTVLNFFASWCPPCRQEMPDFEAAHQEFKDRVNFVGLATGDEDAAAIELVTETGVTYPTGSDANQDAYFALGGIAMPTTIFLNAQGEVVNTWFGILIPSDLNVLIEELI